MDNGLLACRSWCFSGRFIIGRFAHNAFVELVDANYLRFAADYFLAGIWTFVSFVFAFQVVIFVFKK